MAEMQAQAGQMLSQVAGSVVIRTIDVDLKSGLIAEMPKHPAGD